MSDRPLHVAVIMDGNGRWALARHLPRSEGHLRAHKSAGSTVGAALRCGVTHLTFFAFSSENWRRPDDEVAVLMQPDRWLVTPEQVSDYASRGVRISFMGNLQDPRIPAECTDWLRTVEERTATASPQLQVTVAFNYGGRLEIAEAVRRFCAEAQDLAPQREWQQYLWSALLPDVDLLIRTSGEYRISNFMLWSLWYAELVFTDTLWPDFDEGHFLRAVEEFRRRKRRWGAVAK